MRFTRPVAVASSLLLCGLAFAQGWIEFASTTDGFRIQTPGEFEIEEIGYLSEYGVVFPARVYSYENEGNRYSVTVVDYRDSQRLHEERIKELNDIYLPVYGQVDVRGSIAYAATNLRKRGGEVTYDAYHYVRRVDGHQLQMIHPDPVPMRRSICAKAVSIFSMQPLLRAHPRLGCSNNLSSSSTRMGRRSAIGTSRTSSRF